MTSLEIIKDWWNNLSSGRKTQICDTHTEIVGSVRRWETLTDNEVADIFNSMPKNER